MGTMNEKRAKWAEKAIKAFAKEVGLDLKTEKPEAVGDLICDLLHWANQNDLEAEIVHSKALEMYQGEIHDNE